jgi:hypothetical protein
MAAISTAAIAFNGKEAIKRAIHGESYTADEQWRVGLYLAQSKDSPGEKVALVRNDGLVGWAYIGDVHIVAEIGRNAFDPENAEKDFQLFTSHPEVQQTAFNLFRQAGAKLVVAYHVEGAPAGGGWERVPGTASWIHRLDPPPVPLRIAGR